MNRISRAFHAIGGVLLILFALSVSAQTYPAKPIRMILPFAGGGDMLARPLAQMLGESLGQSVYVENIVGGQTLVGTEAAARAPGDGHTILMITNSATINHTLRTDMRVDLFKDFVPVTQLCTFSLVLVTHPSVPAESLQSLIGHAKANPGRLAYGSAGPLYQLPTELFKTMAGVDILYVPYKASATSRIDVLSGQIQVLMDGLTSMLPQIRAGKVRAMAVAGMKRFHAARYPDLCRSGAAGLRGRRLDWILGAGRYAGPCSESAAG
ncbi:MAG: tripartite tricarboxylate transporter substrate binding protein [Betaproteobacteria bacterium]|nr:tripartite tricarboxylate transporter substrate binding protein [Betaproteobacteria bacterium]